MNVRDALEADADALASIANSPVDVMRNLVHDRTVRVAEDGTHDPNADVSSDNSQYGGSNPEDLLGFVSFDAQDDTVYVTQIDGTGDACERLLAEPVRFAECEKMAVEILVPERKQAVAEAAETLGFVEHGFGPHFEDGNTIRYRLEC